MASKKSKSVQRSNNEIRQLILEYFYERNKNATSRQGKKGSAVKISDVKKELKAQHSLSASQVVANLTYLIDQGWVAERTIEKKFTTATGTVIPQMTCFYAITAAGIDRMEGEGEFTMDRFKGIRIEATGQNIITIGDGNVVNASFKDVASALSELRSKIVEAPEISEEKKMDSVSDVDTIQAQLSKATPNKSVITAAWDGIKNLATVTSLAVNVSKVAELLTPLLG